MYICTGRSKAEVYPYLWDIGLDGMIGGNGSYVEDGDTVVMHQLITAEQCKHIVDWLKSTWGGAGEIALFGDLGVKDITKAHAIDALLEYLGADIEDTYAFGDAKIDIPMLDYCHIGVAMGSGGDEIKAMADYITDDVDQDGLYNAFVRFGLIEAE